MTQFETSQAGVASRLEQGFQLNTSGIGGSLTTPGLTATPPLSRSANQFARLSQSLGLIGGLTDGIARQQYHNRVQDEKAESALAKIQEGLAQNDVDTEKERIRNAAANGEFDSFLGEELDTNIEQYAVNWNDEGQSEAYRKKAVSLLRPFLATELAKREQTLLEAALEEDAAILADRAAGATTADEITGSKQAFLDLHPTATETDALGKIVLPSLRSAAAIGDTTRFNAALEALGGRFPTEAREAELQLQTTLSKADSEQHKQAVEIVEGMRLKREPVAAIKEAIHRLVRDKRLSNAKAVDLEAQVEAEQRRIEADRAKVEAKAQRAAVDNLLTSQNLDEVFNARATGGAANFEDIELTLADGSKYLKTATEQKEEAIAAAFDTIDREVQDPRAAMNRKVALLADNNAIYDLWQARLGSGFSVSDSWFLSMGEGESTAPPPLLIESYKLYKELGAVSPIVRNRHVPSVDAETFYRMAELAERRLVPGEEARALSIAGTARQKINENGRVQLDSIRAKKLASAVDSIKYDSFLPFDEKKPNNTSELGAVIENVAQIFTAMGINPDRAVDEAKKLVKEDYQIVNNWAIDTRDARLPENINDLVKKIAKDYTTAFPDEGVSASSLSLSRTGGDAWVLIDKTTGIPVENATATGIAPYYPMVRTRPGLFTTQDFADMAASIEGVNRVEQRFKRAETIHRTIKKDRPPTPIVIERGRP